MFLGSSSCSLVENVPRPFDDDADAFPEADFRRVLLEGGSGEVREAGLTEEVLDLVGFFLDRLREYDSGA